MSSGTGAYVIFQNEAASDTVTIAAGHHVCMQKSVNNLDVSVGPSSSNQVYVEASDSANCFDTQSQFSFTLSDSVGTFAELGFNLGDDKFNTQLNYNTCPGRVSVSLGKKNSSHAISIGIGQYSSAQALITGAAWASGPQIQATLSIPPLSYGPFSFSEATLAGISNLVCTSCSVSGTPESGAGINAFLYVDELDVSCTLSVKDIGQIGAGISLKNVALGVVLSAVADRSPSASNPYSFNCSMCIKADQLSLLGGTASAHNLPLPDVLLNELFVAAQVLVSDPNLPLQQLILTTINSYLPGNSSDQDWKNQ